MVGTVLVTGGSGFFGTHLVNKLLEQGRKVKVLDINDCNNPLVEFIKADIQDREAISKALVGVKTVFHLASLVPQSKVPYESYYKVIVKGTENILEACKQHSAKLVYISSSGVYGGSRSKPLIEDSEKNPSSDYGKAKWEAEKKCLDYKDKVELVILRPMAIIGPGIYGVFKLFLKFIKWNLPLIILGKGKNKIQMVSVHDIVEAALLAENHKRSGAIFNIGSDNVPELKTQFKSIITHANSKSLVIPLPAKLTKLGLALLYKLKLSPLLPEHYYVLDQNSMLDIEKAKKELGWKPKYDNINMMSETFDWLFKK
jgi:nucleoside-diphosphate-sugar epimerase